MAAVTAENLVSPPSPSSPPPPQEKHFPSREALLQYVHEFSIAHGYAVVIQKSNLPRGQVWLRCDLGGVARRNTPPDLIKSDLAEPPIIPTGSRKRKSSSRLLNCPFQLYGRRLPDSRWVLKVQNGGHNHSVSADPAQLARHPFVRRLTLEQKQMVDELTRLGARPARIVEKLKEKFPDKPVKVQDIYNMRNYIRRERTAGREPFSTGAAAASNGSSGNIGASFSVVDKLMEAQAETDTDADGTSHQSLPPPPPPSDPWSSSAGCITEEQLQDVWRRVSYHFPAWTTGTQQQFLFQLELLMDKCRQDTNQSDNIQKDDDQRATIGSSGNSSGDHQQDSVHVYGDDEDGEDDGGKEEVDDVTGHHGFEPLSAGFAEDENDGSFPPDVPQPPPPPPSMVPLQDLLPGPGSVAPPASTSADTIPSPWIES